MFIFSSQDAANIPLENKALFYQNNDRQVGLLCVELSSAFPYRVAMSECFPIVSYTPSIIHSCKNDFEIHVHPLNLRARTNVRVSRNEQYLGVQY
jgi:hypothetical protein